jgi:hypothetical protein
MARQLLPDNKWVYLSRNNEDTSSGMWIYICGDNPVSQQPEFHQKRTQSDQQVITTPQQYTLTQEQLLPTTVRIYTNQQSSYIPAINQQCYTTPPELFPYSMDTTPSSPLQDAMQVDSFLDYQPEPVQKIITPIMQPPVIVDPDAIRVMNKMLNKLENLELEQFTSRMKSKNIPCSVHAPKTHKPTILIEPELNQEEKTQKPKKTEEYDPLKPEI